MKRLLLIVLSVVLCSCSSNNSGTSGNLTRSRLADNSSFYGRAVSTSEEKNLLAQKTYYFAFNSAVEQHYDLLSIYAHANNLFKHPKYHLRIEGHTDERGSHAYNNALGERRAQAIAAVLMLKGVPARQFSIVSFGKEKPCNKGHDARAWQLNRRVELVYEMR
ncbi:MAG: peptidoglycan-associated lipoprotein [Legionellales bacterium]|nr:MAG: peptidoglycan-associated lipoprotein [Legionellales bacterium]